MPDVFRGRIRTSYSISYQTEPTPFRVSYHFINGGLLRMRRCKALWIWYFIGIILPLSPANGTLNWVVSELCAAVGPRGREKRIIEFVPHAGINWMSWHHFDSWKCAAHISSLEFTMVKCLVSEEKRGYVCCITFRPIFFRSLVLAALAVGHIPSCIRPLVHRRWKIRMQGTSRFPGFDAEF